MTEFGPAGFLTRFQLHLDNGNQNYTGADKAFGTISFIIDRIATISSSGSISSYSPGSAWQCSPS